jgi:F420-non-reducing hydrogenase large subunit
MIPGGQSKAVTPEMQARLIEIGEFQVEFARASQQIFADIVLAEQRYLDLILADAYAHRTYYMALVDENDALDDYHGQLRVVDPDGREFAKFAAEDYLEHIAEHVEPWSYLKFPFLKQVGWQGFADGADSGIYRVAPLGMLNAAARMQTPLAQAEHDKMFETLGGKPVHATLAFHWARIIEMLQAAELTLAHARDERLTDPNVRTVPTGTPREGVGVVEAPRGILIHHYVTDADGLVERANLIVGTTHNYGPIQLSVKKAAASLIESGKEPDEGLLNMIEMAFRAYDPCFGCATHSLPGRLPLEVTIRGADGAVRHRLRRGIDGAIEGGAR